MAPPVSPGLERQGSGKHSQNRGSGSNHRGGGSGSGGKSGKSGGEERDKKEKDLQWLEKELQKIEREKLRLEREREKYMERESRLEKIREAMKHQPPSSSAGGRGGARQGDEICIRTSTGEFRFQVKCGISVFKSSGLQIKSINSNRAFHASSPRNCFSGRNRKESGRKLVRSPY